MSLDKFPKIGFASREGFAAARRVFERVGYDESQVVGLFGGRMIAQPDRAELPMLVRRLRQPSPLELFVRLFLLGLPVDEQRFRDAVRPQGVDEWIDANVVSADNGQITARIHILPFQGWLIASDFSARPLAGAANRVMGVTGSTVSLAHQTIRRPVTAILDLGTGSGVQAILSARHSQNVVGTDPNEAAIEIARFNVKLNGVENVEIRQGAFFDPVNDQQFDLVVANPPFVISPDTIYHYRDGGLPDDQFLQKLVTEAPQYLEEDGYCQIVCDWIEVPNQPWYQRLAGWFDGCGCDTWIVRRNSRQPEQYAASWRDTNADSDAQDRQQDRWMDYFERAGIASIGSGMVVMRRRRGMPNWFRADSYQDGNMRPTGDDYLAKFEAFDFLARAQDERVLLKAKLKVSPSVRLEQRCAPSSGGWAVESTRMTQTSGFVFGDTADRLVTELVGRCDGTRELGDVVRSIADGEDSSDDPATLEFARVARRLVARGILLPDTSINSRPA